MNNRYLRNVPALTEAECTALRSKTVAVIGCGGLGGYLIEYLARIGVGCIRCVDGDVFEESNLNRQLLSTASSISRSKAEAAAARIREINPDVQAESHSVFLDSSNAGRLIRGCHGVLDGLDTIESRRILADACQKEGIPHVYGAISGWVAQAAISMPGDRLIERLYPEDAQVKDKSVLSFTPALCAAMQASLCVKLLTGRPMESGKLHYVDLLCEEYEKTPVK